MQIYNTYGAFLWEKGFSSLKCMFIEQGTIVLPSRGKMWEDIISKEDAMRTRYTKSQRHTIQVDWLPFMDEIAEFVGCKPTLCE